MNRVVSSYVTRDDRPLILAHRGASAVAPESTRAAIRAAVRLGADAVELDVQLTQDGRLVVYHDERLERTTDGAGRLRDTKFSALARLDAGRWFGPRFAGERVLLASQALRLIPRRMGVNLELKRTDRRERLMRPLLRLLARVRHPGILLSSFDPRLLQLARRSGCPLGLITRHQPDRALSQAIRLRCASWHPFHRLVTARRVRRAHAAGLRVHAWTVDDPGRARRLVRLGVDGLFTNNPARLIRALQ